VPGDEQEHDVGKQLLLAEPVTAARQYNLTDVVDQISTPLLITDPEGEQFWPGQPQQLFDKLRGAKRLIQFNASEGADSHCEPMARSLLEQRMFDWLDETLPAATSRR
jgi:hypothetical protein